MTSDVAKVAAASPPESPYTMKEQDRDARKLTPTTKSYRSQEFLNSREARTIRILCEFEEPASRLMQHRVRSTALLFGSARAMRRVDYDRTFANLQRAAADAAAASAAAPGDAALAAAATAAATKARDFQKVEWMCEWVDKAETLARLLTEYAMTNDVHKRVLGKYPDYLRVSTPEESDVDQGLVVTTGGGPGLMEAANRGAASVPGAKTMGMGISLPFEKGLNPYVTPGLAFEFHYFFTRKFWMMYSARALIVAPGGFGTMDEMFELLTLRQTKKIPDLPIILFGKTFWTTVINWQSLADFGVVSQREIDGLCFADTPEEAMVFIEQYFIKAEAENAAEAANKRMEAASAA